MKNESHVWSMIRLSDGSVINYLDGKRLSPKKETISDPIPNNFKSDLQKFINAK